MSKKKNNTGHKTGQLTRNMEAARAKLREEQKKLWLIAGGFVLYLVVFNLLLAKGLLPFSDRTILIVNIVIIIILALLLFRQLGRVNDCRRQIENIEKKLSK